jgi:antitoxin MazE
MQTKVKRWGHSLAVRIPRSVAADAHVEEASTVDVQVVDGKIVITPASPPKFTLAELLARVTHENLHPEVSVGPSAGAEGW